MPERDLRIKANHEDLAQLKEALYATVDDIDLQEDTELRVGQHGEPLLIGLVIALGGATLTREILLTIRHWIDERAKERKLGTIELYIKEGGGSSRNITLEELMKLV